MWLSFVGVLYFFTQPLKWDGKQGLPMLDLVALLDAASLAAIVPLACWLFLFPLTWNTHPSEAALFGISSTWVASRAIFLWIDGRQFVYDHRLTNRASEVLAEGQDIVFMPLVIPCLALASGAIFAGVIWLSKGRKDRAAGE